MLGPNELAERARTESTLQRLEGARDHVGGTTPPPVVIERKRGVADGAFWGVLGVGALALAGAGTTGALALTTEHESERFRLGQDGGQRARDTLVQRADRLAFASDVLLIAGASLGITAILLYTLRERTVSESAQPLARLDWDVRAWSDGAYFALRGNL
jgi:hypothetical protein